jgi:hypothetical protein
MNDHCIVVLVLVTMANFQKIKVGHVPGGGGGNGGPGTSLTVWTDTVKSTWEESTEQAGTFLNQHSGVKLTLFGLLCILLFAMVVRRFRQ